MEIRLRKGWLAAATMLLAAPALGEDNNHQLAVKLANPGRQSHQRSVPRQVRVHLAIPKVM